MSPDQDPFSHDRKLNDDASLVLSFLNGDIGAFERIYMKHHSHLLAIASNMIPSHTDAADVVQEVFAIAIERLHQLENHSALTSWLLQILRREIYRRTRESRAISSSTNLATDITDLPARRDPRGEAAGAIADEAALVLRHSLAGLHQRDQAIFIAAARQQILGSTHSATHLGPLTNYSVSRMTMPRLRERLSASRSAYLVARHGQQRCLILRQLLKEWGGEYRPLIRKRINRHIETCAACKNTRRITSATLIPIFLGWSPTNVPARWPPGIAIFSGNWLIELGNQGHQGL